MGSITTEPLSIQNIRFPTPPPRQDTFPLSHTSPHDSLGSLVQAQLEPPFCPVLPWLPRAQPSWVALCRSLG